MALKGPTNVRPRGTGATRRAAAREKEAENCHNVGNVIQTAAKQIDLKVVKQITQDAARQTTQNVVQQVAQEAARVAAHEAARVAMHKIAR